MPQKFSNSTYQTRLMKMLIAFFLILLDQKTRNFWGEKVLMRNIWQKCPWRTKYFLTSQIQSTSGVVQSDLTDWMSAKGFIFVFGPTSCYLQSSNRFYFLKPNDIREKFITEEQNVTMCQLKIDTLLKKFNFSNWLMIWKKKVELILTIWNYSSKCWKNLSNSIHE